MAIFQRSSKDPHSWSAFWLDVRKEYIFPVGYSLDDVVFAWTGHGVNTDRDMKLSQFDLIRTPTGNGTKNQNKSEFKLQIHVALTQVANFHVADMRDSRNLHTAILSLQLWTLEGCGQSKRLCSSFLSTLLEIPLSALNPSTGQFTVKVIEGWSELTDEEKGHLLPWSWAFFYINQNNKLNISTKLM